MYKIERFTKEVFDEPRRIRVYLPIDANDPNRKYPVLYMHDGHNLFDVESSYSGVIWDVHTALEEIEKKYHRNCIVVGIDCHPKNRFSEYSPWVNRKMKRVLHSKEPVGGKGKDYIDWIVTNLKPFIDQVYPTITNETYLAGSSMGGLISLYAGYRYPAVFSKVGCFSSAFWFAKKELKQFIKEYHTAELGVYLDVGTAEDTSNHKFSSYLFLKHTNKIKKLIEKKGTRNLKFLIIKGGKHSEMDWQERFPEFAKWLLEIKD